ncbi:transcription initiation factor IIB 2 [Halomicroarcula limicola]|uniref:Transcription initiation factor IIB n=1 Tax=Haloarcula limicola TaxID=1429915 RepID=A0A8J7Y4Q8_9EURY|nr:TFIIB-type zinc ribbon-containing protein [Halomicroarcula limicola]MBV0923977.1 transcription initiation factor IIB 2 [Halomicroarcula limicola]
MTTLTTYDADERDSTVQEEETERGEHACPDCGGNLTQDGTRGETVCADCGLVVDEDAIDHGPEWRAFDSAERDQKSRVGAPTTKLMHDEGLSTNIGWQNKDANGNSLSSRQREKMQRLRTWNERFRTRDHSERNLKQALGEIDRMGSALGVPESARETAGVVYRRALDEGLLPGRSIEGIATASLYAAIRQTNLPQTIDDMVVVSRVDEQEFTRAYRYINRELALEIGPPDPANYLTKFASKVDASDELAMQARDLIETGKDENVHSGKSPVGLAAAAIYAAGLLVDEELTQETVSEATDVSTVTIRDRYRELLEASTGGDAVETNAPSGPGASA